MPRRVTAPSPRQSPAGRSGGHATTDPAPEPAPGQANAGEDEFVPMGWSTGRSSGGSAPTGAEDQPAAAEAPAPSVPGARRPDLGGTVPGGTWPEEDASDDVAEPEPADAGTAPAGDRPARAGSGLGRVGSWGPLRWAATVVVVLVVAAVVWGGLALRHDSDLNAARTSGLQAARADATTLVTYDYRHLHRYNTWLEAHSTSGFRKDYMSTEAPLDKTIVQFHASASGRVLAAGVSSATTQQVVVVLFVDQSVTNPSASPKTTTTVSRLVMTLVHGGSGWLMAKAELL